MEEENKKLMTLIFPVREGEVLLGMKKVRWGAGNWNGFGGKVKVGDEKEEGEEDEAIESAAVRELAEEVGLIANSIEKKGVITFHNAKINTTAEVHVFTTDDFSGEPTESDEMTPQWFKVSELPLSEMWRADKEWVPRVFEEGEFKGEFFYNENDELVDFSVENTKEEEKELSPEPRITLR